MQMTHYSSIILTAWLALQLFAPSAKASDLSGAATLTSQYIYRALKMSDGNPALQLGLDCEHDTGLFAGIWASTVDLSTAIGQRDTELDYYAGFRFESDAPVSAVVTVLRYTYPGQTTIQSYDYTEVLFGASWHEHYSIEIGYTNNLYGFDRIGRHWELRSEWPVANTWVLGAALGGNDMSDAGVSQYLHWDVGASARFSRLTFDLRWYDNEPIDGFAAYLSANSQFVLSISAAF
jgi:uncharacterized protein (TIGR02001 family)